MIIESIELKNYRNYESLKLSLGNKNNIFYGDNAQGKTNLLEAIFFAASSKSFRFCKDRDVIRFSEEEAHIKMILQKCFVFQDKPLVQSKQESIIHHWN